MTGLELFMLKLSLSSTFCLCVMLGVCSLLAKAFPNLDDKKDKGWRACLLVVGFLLILTPVFWVMYVLVAIWS